MLLCLKPVSHAGFGDDVPRACWVGFQFPPQVVDVDPQQMLWVFVVCAAPYLAKQLTMG